MQNKSEGFVALFDILGFKEWINNAPLDDVIRRYENMKKEIETNTTGYINYVLNKPIIATCIFSDTFLIYTNEATEEGFKALLMACRFIFGSSCTHKQPIRGSIAVGEFYASGGIVIGKPIIKAYENEKEQEWIGCLIEKECKNKAPETFGKYLASNTIVEYQIPFKKGDVTVQYAYNWVKELSENTAFTIEYLERCFLGKKPLRWTEVRKHENTKKFIDFIWRTKKQSPFNWW